MEAYGGERLDHGPSNLPVCNNVDSTRWMRVLYCKKQGDDVEEKVWGENVFSGRDFAANM